LAQESDSLLTSNVPHPHLTTSNSTTGSGKPVGYTH